jgi:DNA polymerase-3 subunit alpha
LFASIERALVFGQQVQDDLMKNQSSLFDTVSTSQRPVATPPAMIELGPWSEMETLRREKELLGFFVSGHPLRKYRDIVEGFTTAQLGNAERITQASTVRVCGIITSVKKKIDKRGNMMAFVGLEDFSGTGECIVFSDAFKQYGQLLAEDAMVMVVGKGEPTGTSLKVIANEIHPIDRVKELFGKSIFFTIDAGRHDEHVVLALKKVLEKYRGGSSSCYFNITGLPENVKNIFYSTRYSVHMKDDFIEEVRTILGSDAVRVTA